MHADILAYNTAQSGENLEICKLLAQEIDTALPEAESKVWHRHPVWFLNGNPVAGYGVLKNCVQLLFWSGQSFDEPGLSNEGSFKAAEARYTTVGEVNTADLAKWLEKSRSIQWNYKDIVKNKGKLERLP